MIEESVGSYLTEPNEEYLSIPKRPQPILESILLFLVIIGAIFTLSSWWSLESVLWNRVIYSTGSAWRNNEPIHMNTPIEEIKQMLSTNIVLLIIGLVCIFVMFGFLMFHVLGKKKWSRFLKRDTISLSIFSGFVSIIGFWLYRSIPVIESLQSIENNESGSEWINGEIPLISNSLSTIGLITAIIFTIIFISSLSLLFIYREKKNVNQPKEKSTSGSAIFSIFKNAPFYIILILYLIFTLLPVYLAIKVSLSSALDIANNANPSDPWYSLILNYSSVMFSVSVDEPAFYTAFMNSIFIGLGTGLIGLLISVSAAYSLARFKFKGNSFMTYLILATQMFPGMILLIPQYVIWKNLGLLTDSMKLYGVLLASSTGSVAYCTWMMKGYFQTVPVDIEEAAIIDGATRFKTFAKIALPLVKSGMVAVMIFTFLTSWQDFVLARTFIGETDPKATLPLLFYNFQNTAAPDIPVYYELLAPYSILVALPVVIFFMLLQKQLAAGAVAGSVK